MIQELIARHTELENDKNSLKLNIDQTMRYIKRYELKLQCLTNKVNQLTKIISEKDAIIKYLEDKNQNLNKFTSKSSAQLDSVVMQMDEANTYRNSDLSFGKLKGTVPKFLDFSNA